MPDKIHLNEDKQIIEVESYDEVSKEDIAHSISLIREVFIEKQFSKILVDTRRQTTMPDTMGIFELFSDFPREYRLAIIIKPGQPTEEALIFAENVGRNRGVSMKLFEDKESAMKWLDDK